MQPSLHLLRLRHPRQIRPQRPRLIQSLRIRPRILIISRRIPTPNKQNIANLEPHVLGFGYGEKIFKLDGVRRERVIGLASFETPAVVVEEHASTYDPVV